MRVLSNKDIKAALQSPAKDSATWVCASDVWYVIM